MPAEASEQMLAALVERDRVRRFLSKLNALKDEGSVTHEQYETAQSDYARRIDEASGLVEQLRPQVEAALGVVRRDLDAHRSELGKLEARFKVQEISLTKLQSDGVQHRRSIRSLQEEERYLAALVDAETAEGLVEPQAVLEPAPMKQEAPNRAAATRSEAGPAPAHERPVFHELAYEAPQVREGAIPRTPLRIASAVAGVLLLISIFLAWVAPTELLGSDTGADPGVIVTFFAALAGLVGGVAAIGFAFIPLRRLRGALHLLTGIAALAALVAAILLEEIPLLNGYFRELVVMREGFYLYIVASAALAIVGLIQLRRA